MSMNSLRKVYDPGPVEERLARWWVEMSYFRPEVAIRKRAVPRQARTSASSVEPDGQQGRTAGPAKGPFCIVIPPPNITNPLHMGHAVDLTIQDVLTRRRRMQGYDTLWLPGTDHAGIATQNMVERELAEKGIGRRDLGREKFEEEVWRWKEKVHGQVTGQLKRLGASCDWSRERFTLDEGCSRAVRHAFAQLYREGLIYRGERIINWCPRCATALSDIEVEHKEIEGKLYYIRYPLGGRGEEGRGVRGQGPAHSALCTPHFLVVATTRPETMLGDTAVAANPQDERHSSLRGKHATLPLMGRRLPVILDERVQPDFGTGLVKITPAHDPDDFEIGVKHGLPREVVIGLEGRMNENAGEYAGLDRYEARERILEDLRSQGLLEKEEPYLHSVGHCYRCKTVIEPMVSLQWFVKMEPLARLGAEAVRSGRVRFVPQRWEKVYLDWLENTRDWCISRQLWWGHRIPVWYCGNCAQECVGEEQPTHCCRCGSQELVQDEDVLDTWFSSALWPFSTLGWPEKTEDLEHFYPTSVLVTGYDIIYFWVARMIMMGMKLMGREPFRQVWIHGLVRDAKGRKMSKSEGNVVDALEPVQKYSADALRYALASSTSLGQDLRLTEERLVGGRNFCNKIWNAARFVLQASKESKSLRVESRESGLPDSLTPRPLDSLPERWIMSRLQRAVRRVNEALEGFRLDEACQAAYEFFWNEFCDWYVEMSKLSLCPTTQDPRLKTQDSEVDTVVAILRHCLRTAMCLLHPVMPFITEEVWQRLNEASRHQGNEASGIEASGQRTRNSKLETRNCFAESICIAPWPEVEEDRLDEQAERFVRAIRWVVPATQWLRPHYQAAHRQKVVAEADLSRVPFPSDEKEALAREMESGRVQNWAGTQAYLQSLVVIRERGAVAAEAVLLSGYGATTQHHESGIAMSLHLDRAGPEDRVLRERLRAELKKAEADLDKSQAKLNNPDFLSRAKPEAVDKERRKEAQFRQKVEGLRQRMSELEGLAATPTQAEGG